MAATETETPIWGDELKDFLDIGTAGEGQANDPAMTVEATSLLSWEFDGDEQTYEPSYINRRTPPKFVLGKTASISYEKDMYRHNPLDEFLAEHEDETDIPVSVIRVRTWEGGADAHGAKMARFSLTPSQLDKNTAGEPVKLKGGLTMLDEKWTHGTFDLTTHAFTPEGAASAPETPPSTDGGSVQPVTPPEKALDDMTVEELKTYAAEHSIDIEGKALKADILAAIKEAESAAA